MALLSKNPEPAPRDAMTEQIAHAIVAVIQHDQDAFAEAAATAVKNGPGTAAENADEFRRSLTRRQPTASNTRKETGRDQ
jgi:hypothetical protein